MTFANPNRRRAGGLATALLLLTLPAAARAQETPQNDPFAEAQMEQIELPAATAGGAGLVVSGFVDTGYIHISQSGSQRNGGDLSWAYGNSQFNFSSQTNTATVNEVDLTLSEERDLDGLVIGALGSVDFYPSRDPEIYQGSTGDRPWQVDQAYVFALFPRALNTRVRLGRAPGVVTLEQQKENDAPDSRLIGHTYVYQAGGGYPYGLQVQVQPGAGLTFNVGEANGGIGDYTFVPGDRSTANLSVAHDKDQKNDKTDAMDQPTYYGSIDYVPFDRPADIGRFQLGAAYANNAGLTYNPVKEQTEPYTFTNVWLAYRLSDYEARAELATLDAYYSGSIGKFEATMWYLLLSYEAGANHLITLRYETIDFVSDVNAEKRGTANKYGVSYRYRIADPMVLKLEYVTETQSPQFFTMNHDLTTNVAALSWIYSF